MTIDVSIHAFRGEGDRRECGLRRRIIKFQSTPSGGKATEYLGVEPEDLTFQSTPSGGKATRVECGLARRASVSIHAFRGEGDAAARDLPSIPAVSIHAFRGEGDTPGRLYPKKARVVSIHAFRGEGDLINPFLDYTPTRFNPRLPGGRRPQTNVQIAKPDAFQSTPSGGKATSRAGLQCRIRVGFNPRLPGGRRLGLPW